MNYKLTKKAEEDIIHIYLHGLDKWGEKQAETYHESLSDVFDLLAKNPKMARLRNEINPPVRIHPFGSHIIIYESIEAELTIIRVRHAHEDWVSSPVELQD